ncbi:MAG: hypothetical protein C7B45_10090 [Sulfobacillus acidophilus]|uniref:Creatininase n=1 Tax=Sulfobacillus acidophilus TaxID=53633 RepID=A0A2T2WHE4_9FIRM|nr:MAG: hypothetical protein C7B45_10090 [Sulfobacillus acidophilus]
MKRLTEMSWVDIGELPRATTLWMMVVGPTEQHGPHLPLGTDFMVAQEMAQRMTRFLEGECGWTVVEVPPLYYVPAVLSREYPGSVSIRKERYRAYLEDVVESYAKNGLLQGVLISTHIDPPFVHTTQEVLRAINVRYGARYIHGYERFPMEDVLSGDAPELFGYHFPGDVHAGILETSSLTVARPELVQWDRARSLEDQPIEFAVLAQSRSFRCVGNGLGYTGYPRLANAHYGEIWYHRYGRLFGAVLQSYCQGEDVFERLSIAHLIS